MKTRLLALLLLAIGTSTVPAGESIPVRAGFPIYAFTGVDPNDAEASSSFYMKTLTQSAGLACTSRLYQNKAELHADMAAEKLDFVLLSSQELIEDDIMAKFEPVLTPCRGKAVEERMCILVHRDSSIRTLADLKGTRLLVFSGAESVLESAWMNRELAAAGLPAFKDHFKSVEYPQGAAKTILPVFFRKADACVVSESMLEMVARLNPQVAKRLLPVVRSEALLTAVLCIRRNYPPEGRKIIIDIALNLGSTPEGRQIELLTKIDGIAAYDPKTFESTRALLTGQPRPHPGPEAPPVLSNAAP